MGVMVAWAVAAALSLGEGGCFVYRGGGRWGAGEVHATSGSPAVVVGPDSAAAGGERIAWPARDPEVVRGLLEATPEWVRDYELAPGVTREEVDEKWRGLLDRAPTRVTYKGIHAGGLVRVYQEPK